ncbi:virulence factor TspB C-terminal domain-related protein [Acinetobacter junii]|uniref:virulence factor TspB C-terminal domain-related protein n=1 Tax=Acinetobacter junii TaxID=40215 RepID=UPI00124FC2C7|nr:virulence factor TspB C-terminal domain-related protein [Acinetobacter junii]
MHNHVANSGRKALLISFLSIFLLLTFSQLSYAADDGDWWLQRQIQLQQNREDYARRVYGSARHTYDTVDPITSKTKTITKIAIVEDVPSKQKLGNVLLERAKKYKSGIAGVLGGAAVSALIEGIGWVMEDGTFVKYKPIEKPNCNTNPNLCGPYLWNGLNDGLKYNSPQESCQAWNQTLNTIMNGGWNYAGVTNIQTTTATCLVQYFTNTEPNPYQLTATQNPNHDPNAEPKSEKITITDEQVGGIVSGDYQDPVDPNYNITDKQYRPVVADAYQHDPTNTGNDLANEMDDKIKNAPPTQDGNPAPIGDPRYTQPPEQDQRTNDRSWNDDGSTATGDTTPTTDPTTGQPTGGQSISLQFPIFCEWAHSMCKWYDDWKASDKVYKDHMTKTEEHQTQEKTFWQSVKDWFDWTKENEDLENDEPEQVNELPLPELQTNAFTATAGCPEPIPIQIKIGVEGTAHISYEPICQFASKWSFIAPLIGFLSGAMILVGVGRKGEDSEI